MGDNAAVVALARKSGKVLKIQGFKSAFFHRFSFIPSQTITAMAVTKTAAMIIPVAVLIGPPLPTIRNEFFKARSII